MTTMEIYKMQSDMLQIIRLRNVNLKLALGEVHDSNHLSECTIHLPKLYITSTS